MNLSEVACLPIYGSQIEAMVGKEHMMNERSKMGLLAGLFSLRMVDICSISVLGEQRVDMRWEKNSPSHANI